MQRAKAFARAREIFMCLGSRHLGCVYLLGTAVAMLQEVNNPNKESPMLSYAITFLIIALIAGFLGFVGVAGLAAEIAKILFVVFLVLFVVSLVAGRSPRI
jgi:uncharacterized membrane protein YtjA (UPF0391 family)